MFDHTPNIKPKFENVPQEMREYDNWLLWKYEQDKPGKKPRKQPYRPNYRKASYNTASHLSSFAEVVEAYKKGGFSGIGFALTKDDPFTGFDLDGCVDELGFLNDESQTLINSIRSFSELSPSGTGIHCICKAQMPGPNHIDKKTGREMYDHDRFLTITANVLGGYKDVVEAQQMTDEFYELWFGGKLENDVEINDLTIDPDATILTLDQVQCTQSVKDLIRDGEGMQRYDEDRSYALYVVCRELYAAGTNVESILEILTDEKNFLSATSLDRRGNRNSAKEWLWKYNLGKAVAILDQEKEDLAEVEDIEQQVNYNLEDRQVDHRKWPFQKGNYEYNAKLILKHVAPVACYRKQFYLYNGKCHVEYDKERIERDVQSAMSGRDIAMSTVDQTIKAATRLCVIDEFTPHPTMVTFSNGCLNLEGWKENRISYELLPHKRSYNAMGMLNFDYDHEAKCPDWEKFLSTAMEGDQERIETIQEILGYSMIADNSIQAIFVFANKSRAGKGVICNKILPRLIGIENYGATGLTDIAGQFGLENLDNKKMTVIADAKHPDKQKIGLAMEKLLNISGQDNQAFQKKHKGAITKSLTTKLLISANQVPAFADDHDALLNRYVIIPFNVSFAGKEDSTLEKRLYREMPGIFNWALKGLVRLGHRGRFKEPRASMSIRESLMLRQNANGYFIKTFCSEDVGESITKDGLYERYEMFCQHYDRKPTAKVWFFRALSQRFDDLQITQKREGSKVVRVIKNVKFNTEKFAEIEQDLL